MKIISYVLIVYKKDFTMTIFILTVLHLFTVVHKRFKYCLFKNIIIIIFFIVLHYTINNNDYKYNIIIEL